MLQVLQASVRFGDTVALDGADLSVADGEVLALLGASGSGKTTLLRAVAGLQPLDQGVVLWDGEDITPVPAHRRNFGLVFQDFALFPHLDVGRNVEFGMKMQGAAPAERAERASAALRRVEMPGLERRPVATLSGGQQQRVALARALAPGPRMLLLDEPLGSLDAALRERLTVDLRGLLSQPGITALYVTHDQAEAFAVADRVAIIEEGRIVQRGTPEEVWRHPATESVARFLGFRSIVSAMVEGGVARAGPLGAIPAPGLADGPARLVIRPDAVVVGGSGHIEARVRSVVFQGSHHRLVLDVAGTIVEALAASAPAMGAGVRIQIDPGGVVALPGADPS